MEVSFFARFRRERILTNGGPVMKSWEDLLASRE
jgi:hypothetical protein